MRRPFNLFFFGFCWWNHRRHKFFLMIWMIDNKILWIQRCTLLKRNYSKMLKKYFYKSYKKSKTIWRQWLTQKLIMWPTMSNVIQSSYQVCTAGIFIINPVGIAEVWSSCSCNNMYIDTSTVGSDCADILKRCPNTRRKDGVYNIMDISNRKKVIYCDMTTDNGGWTVISLFLFLWMSLKPTIFLNLNSNWSFLKFTYVTGDSAES